MKKILTYLFVASIIFSCKTQKVADIDTPQSQSPPKAIGSKITAPPLLIYKTKKDYRHNVPVILSDDKTKIISYPHPRDLMRGEELAIPTQLVKGYLLDNRGINENVAFIKYTYEEYVKLNELPTVVDLYEMIIDKDPLVEMWSCGTRSAYGTDNLSEQLNEIIVNREVMREKFVKIK